MSGETPIGGGLMRQRHNSHGYASSSDDLEDDACSKASTQSTTSEKKQTLVVIVENFLWIASTVFIVYYGDLNSNLIYLLWHDGRIKRVPLYLGMVAVGLNLIFFLYSSLLAWRTNEKWDFPSTLPFVALLGIVSFFLFSFALWPIWSFLTLPLVFTLFMAGMVLVPYLMLGTLRPQTNEFRMD